MDILGYKKNCSKKTSRIFSGRTRTNFGLRLVIRTAHWPELTRIHKTNDRHHTKIPRKKLPQFDFQPRPARAGVATARGPRARATGGWPDFGRRLRTNHASASKSETCSGLFMESGSGDMLKLKRKAKNKIDQNLVYGVTQYTESLF